MLLSLELLLFYFLSLSFLTWQFSITGQKVNLKPIFTSNFQQFGLKKFCWSHYYVIWLQMINQCTSVYIFGFRIFKAFFWHHKDGLNSNIYCTRNIYWLKGYIEALLFCIEWFFYHTNVVKLVLNALKWMRVQMTGSTRCSPCPKVK